jgi:hypothetical protein
MRFKHFSSLPQYKEQNISEGVIIWALIDDRDLPSPIKVDTWEITLNYNTDNFGLT